MDSLSPPRRYADPNIVALLSLKLLLLGFFILLNALSRFEEDRSRSVIVKDIQARAVELKKAFEVSKEAAAAEKA